MTRTAGTRTMRTADGRCVWLRPVRRADLAGLDALLMGLSPRSRRLRFHGAVNALPVTALRELSTPDDVLHATLVAEAAGSDGRPRLVAEGRWIRETPDTPTAEFALSVADDWQRLGLARTLLDRLRASAAEAGVQRLYGSVLDENHGMLALMASQGARPRRDPRGGWGLVWTLDTEATGDTGAPASAPVPAPASLHDTLASAA